MDDAELACRAVLVYAASMATNTYRSQGRPSFEVAVDVLKQFCKNAASGHAACSKTLDGRWVLAEDDGSVAGARARKA